MQDYIDFSLAFTRIISDFLSTPPIFYLFGLFCFGVIVNIVFDIFNIRRR